MKLKLPAYGKRLLDERRANKHPLQVTLVYGDSWFKGRAPRICLKPDDYEPGKYDFRMVAGLRVEVFDEFGAGFNPADKFCDLLGELGAFAALVWISWPDAFKAVPVNMRDLAWQQRAADAWPRWWSDERERAIEKRFDGWFADLMAGNRAAQPSSTDERVRAA